MSETAIIKHRYSDGIFAYFFFTPARHTTMSSSLNMVKIIARHLLAMLLSLAYTHIYADTSPVTSLIYHELDVQLKPEQSLIFVEDKIQLPEHSLGFLEFKLHKNLRISYSSVPLTTQGESILYRSYRLPNQTLKTLSLTYSGIINHPVKPQTATDRSQGTTPGIISPNGVYLSQGSYWYPQFSNDLLQYRMQVDLPPNWQDISLPALQKPSQGIYLIAGTFEHYQDSVTGIEGPITLEAYLDNKDDALAQKYMATAARYLRMYEPLLGAYPYQRFAVVENFWESGLGMPGFTLLGSKILRFPFILHSSYPHELLHNWWGNGVFVDPKQGNWSEGLSTYLADHLIAEQNTRARDYRRDALLRYTHNVPADNRLTLADFRSRHDAKTEAVGYVKGMMVWEMLRTQIGEQAFVQGLRYFYEQHRFKQAGYAQLQQAFEHSSGRSLTTFFRQWLQRSDIPLLHLFQVKRSKNNDNDFVLQLTLQQKQTGPAFDLQIPVQLNTAQGALPIRYLHMTEKNQSFVIDSEFKPQVLTLDPQFQLMRGLDPNETAASLGQAFAQKTRLFILPSQADAKILAGYHTLIDQWRQADINTKTVMDNSLSQLPDSANIWILGDNNQFTPGLFKTHAKQITQITSAIQEASNNSELRVFRAPEKPEHTRIYLHLALSEAAPALAKKLPHYSKYSYLAFEGAGAENILKGRWRITGSALQHSFETVNINQTTIDTRPALASLPAQFSQHDMQQHVKQLTQLKMQGRGLGTHGLTLAADYLEQQFKQAGLVPLNNYPNYRHPFTANVDGVEFTSDNLIGIIPGTAPNLAKQSIVISAHYDHLGMHKNGKPYEGADDNASGLAILLSLAQYLKHRYPTRTLIFMASSAEEHDLQGVRAYLQDAVQYPAEDIFANINMDTVGRLDGKAIQVFGADSAYEWPHIFRGIAYVTGQPIQVVKANKTQATLRSSDHSAFLDAGIPAVHIFSGAHFDIHQTSDTADKLDYAGMLKVAEVVLEALDYLSEREPLLNVAANIALNRSSEPSRVKTVTPAGLRKVATGILPDFTYSGVGVRVEELKPNSAAAKAGIQTGDIVIKLNEKKLLSLRDYAQNLRAFKPGQEIKLTLMRGDKTLERSLRVYARSAPSH